jgi:hypothetical protein
MSLTEDLRNFIETFEGIECTKKELELLAKLKVATQEMEKLNEDETSETPTEITIDELEMLRA